MTEVSAASAISPGTYCPRCGDPAGDHAGCRQQLEFEPPRFCADCGRRLVVQVTPGGWTARCSQHGEITS